MTQPNEEPIGGDFDEQNDILDLLSRDTESGSGFKSEDELPESDEISEDGVE